MNIQRRTETVLAERWARYKYNLTTPIGNDGRRITSSEEHIALSRRIAAEGMVLLENNGLLPLKKGTCVALFGIGSIDYIKGGGGSGSVFSAYTRNLYEGFQCKTPAYSVYEPLTRYYYEYALPRLAEHDVDFRAEFAHNALFSEIDVPEELIKAAAENADVAVITIHRFSCEGVDRKSEKGDFYLTDTEQRLVDSVTGFFDHSVVVLDVGGMVDVAWAKNNPKIDAVLLAWQAGMEGGLAIADILCGDVNPSGRLVDTFAKEFSDYPSADTFNESEAYVDYFEDIYVGYRYFETIQGAKDKVIYPFGYGLSYTSFEISKPIAVEKEGSISVSVTVKNTGNVTGREVVQCYYSAPQGVLGKSRITLAGFQKTKPLLPGQSQIITVEFPVQSMASYDDLGKLKKSAYLLEKGEYVFYAGNHCRNLVEADYRYRVEAEFVVTQQLTQKCAPNLLARRMLSDGSFEALPSFPIEENTAQYPKNTAEKPEEDKMLTEVAEGKITLDEFIAQLTDDELIGLLGGTPSKGLANTGGMGDLSRLGIPAIMTVDGPAGVRLSPDAGIATTAWPCATLLACTWDTELAYEMGKAGALEVKENGMGIWLTPALNIHRNPLCGRNFEYFSEDPLISGEIAAAEVNGIQSVGIGACAKHFAANNKEIGRLYSDSRISERALREIYLKGFEICVKKSQPWTLMTSYNLINDRRCCESYEQLQGILREEWGFTGMVTTDWGVPCNHALVCKAGNDIRMHTGKPEDLTDALNKGTLKREHMEVCVRRILEMILKFE